MAGTWQRIKGIFQAKANKALDKAEDPRDMLDLSYEQQLQQLQKIRRSVADVATARKRIELQAQGLQKQADKLQGQAKAALQQSNEDLAREALARRAALGEQLTDLKVQHDQIIEQEQKLVDTSQQLQSRVEQFRTRKETLKASYTAAEATTKVNEAVSGISDSMGNSGAAMQRAQDKIAGMQARAGALDELIASGAINDLSAPVDDIQKELDKVTSTSQVDNELAALKAELGSGGADCFLRFFHRHSLHLDGRHQRQGNGAVGPHRDGETDGGRGVAHVRRMDGRRLTLLSKDAFDPDAEDILGADLVSRHGLLAEES